MTDRHAVTTWPASIALVGLLVMILAAALQWHVQIHVPFLLALIGVGMLETARRGLVEDHD
jgi:hypothetical protein